MENKFVRAAKALANFLAYDYHLHEASPDFCVQLLNFPNMKMFTKLHRKLKSSTNDWIVEFVQAKGLIALILCIEQLSSKPNAANDLYNSIMLSKCVCCIKELLNLKIGMDYIIEVVDMDPTCIQTMSKGIFTTCFYSKVYT